MNPNLIPDDYRIANRPGNLNWRGVKYWFNKAAGVKPTTDPAKLAADAIAETWQLDNGKRDRIEELINEQYAPRIKALEQDIENLCDELRRVRMEGQP